MDIVQTIRVEYLRGIYELVADKKKVEAKKLFTKLKSAIPASLFPYKMPQIKTAVESLDDQLK